MKLGNCYNYSSLGSPCDMLHDFLYDSFYESHWINTYNRKLFRLIDDLLWGPIHYLNRSLK